MGRPATACGHKGMSMDRMDSMLFAGIMPAEPPAADAPRPGESYYWDARGEGWSHETACRLARRRMREALWSATSATR